MTPQTGRAAVARSVRRSAGAAAATLLIGLGLTGSGVVKTVKQTSGRQAPCDCARA